MRLIELLSDESKWTQGEFARDSEGNSVPAKSKNAVCWCLLGAVSRCYSSGAKLLAAERLIRQLAPSLSTVAWQDDPERKYSEVYAVLVTLAELGY